MARIRTIKPEFWQHEDLSTLQPEVHMLAASLLNYADDDGFFNANPKLVKAGCLPLRDDSVDTTVALLHLSDIGFIKIGTGEDGRRYGSIVNFAKHQVINKKGKSKFSLITIVWDDKKEEIENTTGTLPEHYRPEVGSRKWEVGSSSIGNSISDSENKNGQQEKIKFDDANAPNNKKGSRIQDSFEAPEEWIQWALAQRKDWDKDLAWQESMAFKDHWISKPGKDGLKLDWQATWRNWVRNSRNSKQKHSSYSPTKPSINQDYSNKKYVSGKIADL